MTRRFAIDAATLSSLFVAVYALALLGHGLVW